MWSCRSVFPALLEVQDPGNKKTRNRDGSGLSGKKHNKVYDYFTGRPPPSAMQGIQHIQQVRHKWWNIVILYTYLFCILQSGYRITITVYNP
jgi:hypothetical protein